MASATRERSRYRSAMAAGRLGRPSKGEWAALCLLLVAVIGAGDRYSPWDGFFTLLYLAPVSLGAVAVGRRFGLALGVIAAGLSYVGKLPDAFVLAGVGELGIFLAVAYLSSSLRDARESEFEAYSTAQDVRVENLRLFTAIEQADDGIVVTTIDGTIRYVNPAFTRITGYSREEVVGRNTSTLKSGVHDDAFYRDLWTTVLAGRVWRGDITNKRKDGILYVERMTIAPVRGDGLDVTHFIAIKRDVTAEKAVEDARARMAAILEATSDFVGTAAPDGRILFVNRAGRRMAGLAPDADVTGMRIADFHPPSVAALLRDQAMSAVLRDGAWRGETRLRSTDGREISVSQVVLAHRTPAGAVDFLSTIMRDLSERDYADAARNRAEQRYRALFAGMLEGFAYCRMIFEEGTPTDFIYLDANPAFERLTGLTDVIGRKVSEVLSTFRDTNPELFAMYARVAATGCAERLEAFVPELDRWLDLAVYCPEPGHFVAVFDNITERKRAEELLRETQRQFRQAQKMEAVGRLAGGVAHDFNNLLGVILGYTELMLRHDETPASQRAKLTQIMKATESATSLTRQLLAFSRKQVLEPKVLDLNALVANVGKMVGRLIGEDIEMVVRPAVDLGQLYADAGQLEQVIMNLSVNSRDAMPDGGQIVLETANVMLAEKRVAQLGDIPPGRYVTLAVGDTGCGMSAETLSHIFEPFFTTKEPGKGTGLGLATVYGIVTQSGGHIVVESEPGEGTTFRIYLPRADVPLDAGPAAERETSVVGGSETLLLAEDDESLRDITREILAVLGYEVLVAANAGDALRISAGHRGTIHALVTDVVMPGLGGRELATRLLAERPDVKVLFMTGYTDDMLLNRGVLDGRATLLHKPFKRDTLACQLRAALDGGEVAAVATG